MNLLSLDHLIIFQYGASFPHSTPTFPLRWFHVSQQIWFTVRFHPRSFLKSPFHGCFLAFSPTKGTSLDLIWVIFHWTMIMGRKGMYVHLLLFDMASVFSNSPKEMKGRSFRMLSWNGTIWIYELCPPHPSHPRRISVLGLHAVIIHHHHGWTPISPAANGRRGILWKPATGHRWYPTG